MLVKFKIIGQGDIPLIESKMEFIPRVGDVIDSVFFDKITKKDIGKSFEVIRVRFKYDSNMESIVYILIEISRTF